MFAQRRPIQVMKRIRKPERNRNEGVIPLEDLVPRKDPKGGKAGSGKAVFGGGPVISGPEGADRQAKKGRGEK